MDYQIIASIERIKQCIFVTSRQVCLCAV